MYGRLWLYHKRRISSKSDNIPPEWLEASDHDVNLHDLGQKNENAHRTHLGLSHSTRLESKNAKCKNIFAFELQSVVCQRPRLAVTEDENA